MTGADDQAIRGGPGESKERASEEILALEDDLERDRGRTARSLAAIQRRLEEAEAQAAGDVRVTETRGREQDPLELLDAELTRLQADWDASVDEALARVESQTRERAEREADRRLAEQKRLLRTEANERVRTTAEKAREDAERRLQDEIEALSGRLEEEARLDAEVMARAAAAEWLSEQTQLLQRETADRAPEEAVEQPEPKLDLLRRPAEAMRARRRAKAEPRHGGEPLDVNRASFEELRGLGLSITEATRVIAYRERKEGFSSVDDLGSVPGLSKKLVEEIRGQLTA
jgi:competence ComEA-like helix-hairpin-helix protein